MTQKLIWSLVPLSIATTVMAAPAPTAPPVPITTVAAQPGFDAAAAAYAAGKMPEARKLAIAAAAKGEVNAQTMLGYLFSQGIGGPLDEAAAARWYGAAARAGEKDAYFGLGMMAMNNRGGLKLEHAAGYLRQAASRNHAEAARRLAELYYVGKGVPQDSKQMVAWLEKAASLNDIPAAYAAGIFLSDGDAGVKADVIKARKYLAQAANAGMPDAMADYGLFLYQGRAGTVDKATAAQWFAKAAQKGAPTGMFLYAYALSKGEGVTRNLNEAYKWLVRAELTNDPDDAKDRATLRSILEAAIPAAQRPALEAAARQAPALATGAATR